MKQFSIKPILTVAILMLGLTTNASMANSPKNKNIIDATHLLAQKYKVPAPKVKTRAPKRSAAIAQLGQKRSFWANNMATSKFEQVPATLRGIGKHCLIYVADDQNVSKLAVERVQSEFDGLIYPTNTMYFGKENNPGLDGDPRVILFLLDIQDGYKNKNDGYVAGYFFAGDQTLQSEYESYARVKSNECEILYIDTYPSDPMAADYLEIVAHEFQHMIHHNHDTAELTWVNEGCSQIAPVLCGFAPPGHYKLLGPKANRSLNNWATWDPMPDYGQVYLWHQFLIDRYLTTKAKRQQFFKALVASKKTSIAGYLEAMEPMGISFTKAFINFTLTNRLNTHKYSYHQPALKDFRLPNTEHVTVFPQTIKKSVNIWGSDAHFVDLANKEGTLTVDFSGYQRFLGPTKPEFELFVALQSSKKPAPPKLARMSMAPNPNDSVRSIGSLKLGIDHNYDAAQIILMAVAPEHISDTQYMPASPFIYDLNINFMEKANAAPCLSASIDMPHVASAIKASISTNGNQDMLQHYSNLLTSTIKQELEAGSLETTQAFIEALPQNPDLNAFRRQILTLLNFANTRNPSPSLKNAINQLK